MDSLKTSKVHRKLDARLKIAGLELMDLLAVFMLAAINNLFLGRTSFAPIFVIILPAIIALFLYFVKRNKPEGYLIHLIRYISTPGHFSANTQDPKLEDKRRRFIE